MSPKYKKATALEFFNALVGVCEKLNAPASCVRLLIIQFDLLDEDVEKSEDTLFTGSQKRPTSTGKTHTQLYSSHGRQ